MNKNNNITCHDEVSIVPIGIDHEKSGENQDFRSKTGKTGHF